MNESPVLDRRPALTRRRRVSRSVNRVILVGNAGADPDVRRTPSGTVVAHLSLATNRRYRASGEVQERTDWHRLTFWGGAAETVERYVRCGNRLYVEGRIEYGSYEREGQSVPTADVVVQEFVFLDGSAEETCVVEGKAETSSVEEPAVV
jgi:single-strand DNA-binding protein